MTICETQHCERIAVTSKLHPMGGNYCVDCVINWHEKKERMKKGIDKMDKCKTNETSIMEFEEVIQVNLKTLLEGIMPVALAKQMGVSYVSAWGWTTGKNLPQKHRLMKLSQVIGVEFDTVEAAYQKTLEERKPEPFSLEEEIEVDVELGSCDEVNLDKVLEIATQVSRLSEQELIAVIKLTQAISGKWDG